MQRVKRLAIIVPIVIAAAFVLLFASPVYTVGEQEQAVVTTFGRVTAVTDAGAHFMIPIVQSVRKVPTYVTQKMYIGYNYDNDGDMYVNEDESRIMTGDDNIVLMDYFLEYKVSDPVAYLYNSDSPTAILKGIAQACARNYVGSSLVDDILTSGKEQAQASIRENIRESLSEYNIGIQILDVKIQDVEPPNQTVAAAFKAVEDAKQKRETIITQANTYSEEKIPAAQSEADKLIQEANANYESRIALARGEAARFNAIFQEYAKYPEVTKSRMYLEMIEELLPEMNIYVNTTNGGSTTLIPIEGLLGSTRAALAAKPEGGM